MVKPYESLNDAAKKFHISNMVTSGFFGDQVVQYPVSGLLPSGEGNFYDLQQVPQGRNFVGHNGYRMSLLAGSEPLNNLPPLQSPSPSSFTIPIIVISGLQEYASGDVATSYIHNAPNPSGGTGELDKTPYAVSFGFEPTFNSG